MDYKNGKIYALRTHHSDEIYIGSTTQTLTKRLSWHHCPSNKNTSKNLFEKYDDVYIELIENYPCESKEQLNKREGEIQREYKEKMVNKRMEGRTDKEYTADNSEKRKEYKSVYNAENKDFIAQQKKIHYEANKEKILEKCKIYGQEHQAEIAERNRIKREANRDAINQRKREIYQANKEKILAQNKASREQKYFNNL